jgi:flagellin
LHITFVSKLQNSLDGGIGNLVDADMAKESAKLQSLQTRQQLGVQAVSIANQSTASILSLFR